MMNSTDFLERVMKDPENELFRFSLGKALFEEGRYRECIPHLEACCKKKEDWMVPRILLGKAWLQEGEREETRVVLNEALALAVAQEHEEPEHEIRALLEDLGSSKMN